MNLSKMKYLEIGSYFHWEDEKEFQDMIDSYPAKFEEQFQVFYSGRHALKHLLNIIQEQKQIDRIWMPQYYCQHVANWMKKNYSNLAFYETQPFIFNDYFEVPNEVGENDVIIINNYWGLATTKVKLKQINGPIIIEDHSHAWLSSQSFDSDADYCFISLRKSLPIPLGGICWKPGGTLPQANHSENLNLYDTWDLMVEAMKGKKNYLYGMESAQKSVYLKQISDVEDGLDISLDIVKMRRPDEQMIREYMKLDVIGLKKTNLDYLCKNLELSRAYTIINRPGYTPFGLMLLFNNESEYSSFREFLIEKSIYPSNLWPNNIGWKYFLNVHIDFRYKQKDMDYLIDVINKWNLNHREDI